MSIHARFSNFISYSGAIWRILTTGLAWQHAYIEYSRFVVQIKMLNDFKLKAVIDL